MASKVDCMHFYPKLVLGCGKLKSSIRELKSPIQMMASHFLSILFLVLSLELILADTSSPKHQLSAISFHYSFLLSLFSSCASRWQLINSISWSPREKEILTAPLLAISPNMFPRLTAFDLIFDTRWACFARIKIIIEVAARFTWVTSTKSSRSSRSSN